MVTCKGQFTDPFSKFGFIIAKKNVHKCLFLHEFLFHSLVQSSNSCLHFCVSELVALGTNGREYSSKLLSSVNQIFYILDEIFSLERCRFNVRAFLPINSLPPSFYTGVSSLLTTDLREQTIEAT